MSLSQALSTSVSGLRTAQIGMSLIASNVANAQTPGYIKKSVIQSTSTAGGAGVGVRVEAINRELDTYIQRQLRVETAGGAYADMRAQFYQRLQHVYGDPGSAASLESIYNQFNEALQGLAASPDSISARSTVISSAQVLAQQLNGMTQDVQSLRSDAERALSDSVRAANDAMQQIAKINEQLATMNSRDAAAASLLDQRDVYIDTLSRLMDIAVVEGDNNQLNIFTNSGIQLVGTRASTLAFDTRGSMTPSAQWSADPSQSGVGTLRLMLPNGGEFDLIANRAIRSGEIAALIEMRDNVLVQAQNQLDSIAGGLASALSDRTTAGTPVTVGAQSGFDIDVGSLLAGNSVSFTYIDNATMQQRTVTLMRVDDPSVLPLDGSATIDPNDQVIGVNFSAGMGSVVAQLNSLFSGRIQFDNPGGSTLRIVDDGAGDLTDVLSVSSRHTVTGFSNGGLEIPFFMDSFKPYSGAIDASGSQIVGFAGRIQVNAALISDPSRLVHYASGTASGDPARPDFIFRQLNEALVNYSPNTGIGTTSSPFRGSVTTFMRQMLSLQGEAAAHASNLAAGQQVVVNALQERFTQTSGVNIDAEMANLITLQTAYGANARVLTAAKEMIETLMQI
jgi:flagellar hook-associated protein 1